MSMDEGAETVAEFRHMNRLVYSRPSSGSLINSRTQKLSYPASLSYGLGATIQFQVNSGSESVWGPSSYIKLKALVGTNYANLTVLGSMLNIVSQARLYHRSGELLEQVLYSDILSNIKLRYETSTADYAKLYTLIGANPVIGTASRPVGFADNGGGATGYFMLPLSFLFGVFNNHGQYIPAQLLAGARIELVLNSTGVACGFAGTGIDASTFEPVLSLDCSQLYDSASKQLLEESADVQSSGLQFTYSTYFSSQTAIVANAGINIDVLQSASITEKVFTVAAASATLATKYEFLPFGASGVFTYQWRIGAHYLPIYAVKDNTEAFLMTQTAFKGAYHQFSDPQPANGGIGVSSFADGNSAVYATSLERSSAGVMLSGDATNNSRVINLSVQGNTQGGFATTFLQYVRTANLMVDSAVVDR